MPDVTSHYRIGETAPVYGSVTADSGTLTISGTPVYTLFDSLGAPVAAHTAANVTGSDPGALATVRAWVNLATSALPAGLYRLVFSITVAGSDSLTRVEKPAVEIVLVAVPGEGARSTLSDIIARLRTMIADPYGDEQVLSDLQLQRILDQHQEIVIERPLDLHYVPVAGVLTALKYSAGIGPWEVSPTLYDNAWAAATPTTSDNWNGLWTFTTAPAYPLSISGSVFDIFGAAADACEAKAADKACRFSFAAAPGMTMSPQQAFDHWMAMAERYRRQARAVVVTQVRNDIGGGYSRWRW